MPPLSPRRPAVWKSKKKEARCRPAEFLPCFLPAFFILCSRGKGAGGPGGVMPILSRFRFPVFLMIFFLKKTYLIFFRGRGGQNFTLYFSPVHLSESAFSRAALHLLRGKSKPRRAKAILKTANRMSLFSAKKTLNKGFSKAKTSNFKRD